MLVDGLDDKQLGLLRAWLIEERHRLKAVHAAHPANLVAQKEDVRAMERALYLGLVIQQRQEAPNLAGTRSAGE
jgi:hypothetical protein